MPVMTSVVHDGQSHTYPPRSFSNVHVKTALPERAWQPMSRVMQDLGKLPLMLQASLDWGKWTLQAWLY